MLDPRTKKWLAKFLDGNVRFDEPMARHTSLRVGGPAAALAVPENTGQLLSLTGGLRSRGVGRLLLGRGTNLLVPDGGTSRVVIATRNCLGETALAPGEGDGVRATAMAGVGLGALCALAIRRGSDRMLPLLGIPGSVGGAIRMNAGTALGSISEVIRSVTLLWPSGKIEEILGKDLRFGYRSLEVPGLADLDEAVILGGRFDFPGCGAGPEAIRERARGILLGRWAAQPKGVRSAGCFFKNPPSGPSAGQLIDRAGLKGCSVGDAQVSEKHANFIVNRGTAAAGEVFRLMDKVRETVHRRFDVVLEPEVRIVGD